MLPQKTLLLKRKAMMKVEVRMKLKPTKVMTAL